MSNVCNTIKELKNEFSSIQYNQYRNSDLLIDNISDRERHMLEQQAKTVAQVIVDNYWTNHNGSLRIVNLVKSIGFKAIANSDIKDPNLSGMLALNSEEMIQQYDSNKVIIVNDNDSIGHQRFTLAHELAHYIFDATNDGKEYYEVYYRTTTRDINTVREYRANKFAANLLMPEKIFRKRFNHVRDIVNNNIALVYVLSEDFGVTATAIRKRLAELNLKAGVDIE